MVFPCPVYPCSLSIWCGCLYSYHCSMDKRPAFIGCSLVPLLFWCWYSFNMEGHKACIHRMHVPLFCVHFWLAIQDTENEFVFSFTKAVNTRHLILCVAGHNGRREQPIKWKQGLEGAECVHWSWSFQHKKTYVLFLFVFCHRFQD